MKSKVFIFLLATAFIAGVGLQNKSLQVTSVAQAQVAQAQTENKLAPKLIVGGVWLNSKPLAIQDLRGKVAIINFWVYSCINCHNSLPTLRAWYAKYKSKGLEIIGVHTPEFESDKPLANVQASLKRDAVTWPVMQDNNNATWKNYDNGAWPTFYLLDKTGRIREVHEGEISSRFPDAIPDLDAKIQELLAEP